MKKKWGEKVEWIKQFRKSKNLDTLEMAKSIGVSKSLYEKIEYGQRTPSANFIAKFKKSFPEVDTNLFFTNKEHDSCDLAVI